MNMKKKCFQTSKTECKGERVSERKRKSRCFVCLLVETRSEKEKNGNNKQYFVHENKTELFSVEVRMIGRVKLRERALAKWMHG